MADAIRAAAHGTIQRLHDAGIEVAILTGDSGIGFISRSTSLIRECRR